MIDVFEQSRQDILNLAKKFNISEDAIEKFIAPNRIVEANLKTKGGKIYKAFRSQHNNKLGPYKGGIRFHPQVTKEEVMALSLWMSLKCAIAGIPLGGGKGGIIVDPKSLSEQELEELSREYIRKIFDVIGPTKDVPAPDVNTNPAIMRWMVDEYVKIRAKEENVDADSIPSAWYSTFTGKPLEHHGLAGRTEATGFGGVVTLKELVKKLKKDPKDMTIAVQGFGNVGFYFSQLAQEAGFQVVAVSDSKGGIVIEESGHLKDLDIQAIMESKKKEGKLADRNSQAISNEELLELPVDILVPSALENVITSHNMKKNKASIIIEMANGPVTPEANEHLTKNGVLIVPDVLANSGGVSGSYIEWKQNIAGEHYEKENVLQELEEIMKKAFDKIWNVKEEKDLSIKEAAYFVALEKLV